MKVTVLETIKKDKWESRTVVFHFLSEENADKFLHVFKDHWCHVDFNKYIVDKKTTYDLLKEIERDPVEYALKSLTWGFSFARDHADDNTTSVEKDFIQKMMAINMRNIAKEVN